MTGFKRAMKFQRIDFLKGVGVFWAVMLVLNIGSYLVNNYFGEGTIFYGIHNFSTGSLSTMSIAGANIWPAFIFFIVYCYEMYYEYFPIAVSFSATRKDFYKSTIIDNLLVTLVFAIVQGILMKVDILAIKALGFIPLTDFGIFNTANDNLILIILSLFTVFLFVTAIMNLLALLNYKIGWKLWIIVGIIVSLFAGIGISFVFGVLDWIMTIRIDLRQLIVLIIPIILSYLVGFMLVKNTNIKNRIG